MSRSSGLLAFGLAFVWCPAGVSALEAPEGVSPSEPASSPEKGAVLTSAPAEPSPAAGSSVSSGGDAPLEATAAPPASPPEEEPTYRGGFAAGVSLGFGFGASNGFPADLSKIGKSAYYTETGVLFAGSASLWIGGALSDWLNFGAGFGMSRLVGGDTYNPAPVLHFHTDIFPLWSLGGAFRDLGVLGEFGFGFPVTETTDEPPAVLIDGAGASYLSGGVFWEGISFWKFRAGPYVSGQYLWSDTIRRPMMLLGFRTTLTTAP